MLMLTYIVIGIIIFIYSTLLVINKLRAGEAGDRSWTADTGVCVEYEVGQKTIKRHGEVKQIAIYYPVYEYLTKKGKQKIKSSDFQYKPPRIGGWYDTSLQWNFKHEIVKVKDTDETFYRYADFVHKNVEYFTVMFTLIAITLAADYGVKKLLEIEVVQEFIPVIESAISILLGG